MSTSGYSQPRERQTNGAYTLFMKRRGDKTSLLLVYVDDIIITGNDEVEIPIL